MVKMMPIRCVPAWTLMMLAACGPATSTDPLVALIEHNTAARGGRAAIEAVHAIEISLTITEPTFAVEGRYVATRGGQMRIDILADGQRVFTEALDGGKSWSMGAGDTLGKPGPPEATAALRHGMEFPFKVYGLHEMSARGHRLRLLPDETLDGVRYSVVQLTLNDGFEVRYYVNPATGLIDRDRQSRALHVEIDPTPQWMETVYTDYRPVAGVLFPFSQAEHVVASGQPLARSAVTSIRANPDIDPAVFAMP